MASPLAMAESPPMLPPDVSSQMGGQPNSALAGVGAQMGQRPPNSGPGGGLGQPSKPDAALPSMLNAVEKVLSHMSRMSPKLQPFVERALDLLKKGVEQVAGGSPGTGGGAGGQGTMQSPADTEASMLPDNQSSMSFPA